MENMISCMVAWILYNGYDRLGFRKYYGIERKYDVSWTWAVKIVESFECRNIDEYGNKVYVSDDDKNLFIKRIEEYEKKGYKGKRIWLQINKDLTKEWIEEYRFNHG